MTDHFTLTLDTAPPADPELSLNGNALVTGDPVIQVHLTTLDFNGGAADVYDMKIWGDVDTTIDPNVKDTEFGSSYIQYAEYYNIKLSAAEGNKTIYTRLRDSVGNETVVISKTIMLDLTRPVVTIVVGVDHARISKVSSHNTASFSWQSNKVFQDYIVRAVPLPGAPHNAGVTIPSINGSLNVQATGGNFAASTPITTTIFGRDLELASPGNTNKIVKVFVKTPSGLWSP